MSDRSYKTRRRVRIWNRDGQACLYCKRPVSLAEVQIDHIIAQSRGGPHDDGNRAASCPRCNNLKGGLSLTDWRGKIQSALIKAKADAIYFEQILASMKDLD